jgi:tetratricopeptide (TPR) repeat protein
MEKIQNYRYPGSAPFMDDSYDRLIFFGREDESKLVFHKILAENLLVLFAKSGIGKTSLLNAGVMQPLRKNDFIPFSIRFNDKNLSPIESVYASIENIVKKKKTDYIKGEKTTLWEFFNTAEFWSEDDKLLSPVLILDQFEEFFTFHSIKERKAFISELAELTKNRLPEVKIVISIREDYLAYLDEMSRYLPDILHNRFRLLPLSREKAKKAIEKPASLETEMIDSVIFRYRPETIETMLNFLCKRHERGEIVTTDEIESFQLQLLCSHIENKMKKSGKNIVEKDDLGADKGMQKVLGEFYERQIKSMGYIDKRRKIRRLCEKGLISAKGNRLSLALENINQKFKVSEKELDELVKSRLLRAEPRVGSIYYELSHDTLIKPIRDSQKKRRNTQFKIGGSIFAVLFLIMAIILGNYQIQLSKNRKINTLYTELERQINEWELSNAEETYKKIIAIDKKSTRAYILLGKALKDNYFLLEKESKNTLFSLKLRGSSSEEVFEIRVSSEDIDKAIEIYNEAIKNDVRNANVYYEVANILCDKNKLEESEENYKKAIELDRQMYQAYSAIGTLYGKKRDYKKAVENYEKSISINNKDSNTYKRLAILYVEQDKPDEAIKVYERAVKVSSEIAYIYSGIAEALKKKEKKSHLDKLYDIAANVDSKDKYYFNQLGYALYEQGKYDEAIEQYKKSISINNKNSNTYKKLAILYVEQDKPDEAIKIYKQAVKISSKIAYIYQEISEALKKRGMTAYLDKVYEIATNVDSKDKYYFAQLGVSLGMKGKYNEAIEQFKKAIKIDSKFVNAYNKLGMILYEQKRYDDAIEQFEKAINLDSEYVYAKLNLTACYLISGYFNKALEFSHNLLNDKKPSPEHALAMRTVSFASLLLQKKQDSAWQEIEKLIEYYKSLDKYHKRDWSYNIIKEFISNNKKLSKKEIDFFLKLIEILEAPKEKGNTMINELETMVENLKKDK